MLILKLILKLDFPKYWYWSWSWNIEIQNIDIYLDIEKKWDIDINIDIDIEKNGKNIEKEVMINGWMMFLLTYISLHWLWL